MERIRADIYRRIIYSVLTFRLDSPRHNSQRRQRASEDIPVSLARVARVEETRARIKGNGDLARSQWALYARNANRVKRQARRSARPTTPATASLWIGCAANRKPVIAWPRLFLPASTWKTRQILGESTDNSKAKRERERKHRPLLDRKQRISPPPLAEKLTRRFPLIR